MERTEAWLVKKREKWLKKNKRKGENELNGGGKILVRRDVPLLLTARDNYQLIT